VLSSSAETILLIFISVGFYIMSFIVCCCEQAKLRWRSLLIWRMVCLCSRMTSGDDKAREVDTAVEDLRRYKAHLSEVVRCDSRSYTMNLEIL